MRTHHALRRALRRRLYAARGDSGVGCRGSGRGAVRVNGRVDAHAGVGVGVRRSGVRGSGDRGMTAIEFVFLTPLFFIAIFTTIQFAMYYFADHVAQAAARAGAREAREQAEISSDWRAKARTKSDGYIDQLGGSLLGDHRATAALDGDTVTMTVTGNVPSIVPGFHITVHEVSSGPVERFVPDGGR